MKQEKDDILKKSRSTNGCISAGYRLYSGSFRRIFRYTWAVALFYALANGTVGATFVTGYPKLMASLLAAGDQPLMIDSSQFATGVWMAVGMLLSVAATVLLGTYGFSLLRSHQDTGEITWQRKWYQVDTTCLWRVLQIYVFAVILCGACTVLSMTVGKLTQGLGGLTSLCLSCLVPLAFGLLSVPLLYCFMKFVLAQGKSRHSAFGRNYSTGMKHFGLQLIVVIMVAIVYIVAAILTSLPAIILFIANMQAQTGTLIGDALGMPTYMTPLTMAVFTMAGFIQAYIVLSAIFPSYYAYGTIDATEEEIKKIKN